MALVHEHLIDDVMLASHGRSHGAWLDVWTNTCTTRYAVMVDSDVEILKDLSTWITLGSPVDWPALGLNGASRCCDMSRSCQLAIFDKC
jgi:hypothetical protein